MNKHVSKWKLRFSEEPEGAECSSLSRRELQLVSSVFQAWLPMLSFMSSFTLRTGDNVYANIRIYGSLYWSLGFFSVVSVSWLISLFLSCAVIISQRTVSGQQFVQAAVCCQIFHMSLLQRNETFFFTELSKTCCLYVCHGANWQSSPSHLMS